MWCGMVICDVVCCGAILLAIFYLITNLNISTSTLTHQQNTQVRPAKYSLPSRNPMYDPVNTNGEYENKK